MSPAVAAWHRAPRGLACRNAHRATVARFHGRGSPQRRCAGSRRAGRRTRLDGHPVQGALRRRSRREGVRARDHEAARPLARRARRPTRSAVGKGRPRSSARRALIATVELSRRLLHGRARGCSSMAESQPSKLVMRVRFPSPALRIVPGFIDVFGVLRFGGGRPTPRQPRERFCGPPETSLTPRRPRAKAAGRLGACSRRSTAKSQVTGCAAEAAAAGSERARAKPADRRRFKPSSLAVGGAAGQVRNT